MYFTGEQFDTKKFQQNLTNQHWDIAADRQRQNNILPSLAGDNKKHCDM